MDKCNLMASTYLAFLRAIYMTHQHNHWTTKSKSFYGNHLLFQRLYESAQENADMAAEKFIGILGGEFLDFKNQSDAVSKILTRYASVSDQFEMSLKIEQDFLKFSKIAYDCFEGNKKMTFGLDDMIMSIASKREESVYLLKQTILEEGVE